MSEANGALGGELDTISARLADPDPHARQVALTELWDELDDTAVTPLQIGRASCRERV